MKPNIKFNSKLCLILFSKFKVSIKCDNCWANISQKTRISSEILKSYFGYILVIQRVILSLMFMGLNYTHRWAI